MTDGRDEVARRVVRLRGVERDLQEELGFHVAETVAFTWDGLADGGAPAPEGDLVAWVRVEDPASGSSQQQTALFALDRTPPAVTLLRPAEGAFLPRSTLVIGSVDDARLARGRALALAERGWGDAGIEARLESEGLREAEVEAAIAGLDPEAERAARLIGGLAPRKAWGLLQRRGFAPETIESALGDLDEGEGEGLG